MEFLQGRGRAYGIVVRLIAAGVALVPGLVAIGILVNGNYWSD